MFYVIYYLLNNVDTILVQFGYVCRVTADVRLMLLSISYTYPTLLQRLVLILL